MAERGHAAVVQADRAAPVGGVGRQVVGLDGHAARCEVRGRAMRPSEPGRRQPDPRSPGPARCVRGPAAAPSARAAGAVVWPIDPAQSPSAPKTCAPALDGIEPCRLRPGTPKPGRWPERSRSLQSSRPKRSMGDTPRVDRAGHGRPTTVRARAWSCGRRRARLRWSRALPARPLPLSATASRAACVPDDPEGVAAQTAAVAGHDRQGRVGGDGGIDGAAAGSQHREAGLRSQVMGAGHGSVTPTDRAGRDGRRLGGVRSPAYHAALAAAPSSTPRPQAAVDADASTRPPGGSRRRRSPPSASARSRTMARPRPEPRLVRDGSAR